MKLFGSNFIILLFGLVNSSYTRYWLSRYHPDWFPPYLRNSLSSYERQWVVDNEQKNEMPILNPRQLDPSLLMICDPLLTPDDIYTGLMTVMVRIEDTLRRRRCSTRNFKIHRFPITVHTLLGQLRRMPVGRIQRHPVLGTYLDTMATRTKELLSKANQCQLDYVLLMKVVRMSMKLLINRITCGFVEIDVLRNRFGWPSKYGSQVSPPPPPPSTPVLSSLDQMGVGYPAQISKLAPDYPFTSRQPYDWTRRLFARSRLEQISQQAQQAQLSSSSSSASSSSPPSLQVQSYYSPYQASQFENSFAEERWPYYPPNYSPLHPYLGALGPDGRQLNGVDTGCTDCDRNRNVIIS